LDSGEVAGWPQRTGLRCLARVERLVVDGDGSGVGDPGSLTAVAGNLPALRDQRAPAAVEVDLPGLTRTACAGPVLTPARAASRKRGRVGVRAR
jgi:hypothetical protein